MACVGGGIDVNWLVLAAACCVRGLVSGGGRGGVVWGWRWWWWAGRGTGVVLAGGLGVPVGRVGVACVRRAALAVLDWLWCRGVGGRRPHGRPGGAMVRMKWVAAGGWCSLVWGVGGGAAGGGGVGGAGVDVVLAGGPGVPVGRVGVACVRRVALVVLDWLSCRGAGGRRPHEPPGGAVVRT